MAGPGKNYTLGRGKLYFAPFKPGTQIPTGERYLGNSPEFNANIESETLDHFSSDEGIREMDESIALQTNRVANFTTDNISAENIALFFFGSSSALAVVAAVVAAEAHDVAGGLHYQLGVTAANPVGARALDVQSAGVNIVVKNGATEYEEGIDKDYTIDMQHGRLYIVPGGPLAIAAAALPAGVLPITVDYKVKASTRTRIISGGKAVEGQLHYIAANPAGENFDWLMPYVKISPNGDYALKGDEWQTIPFSVQILKKGDYEALYIDGQPAVA